LLVDLLVLLGLTHYWASTYSLSIP